MQDWILNFISQLYENTVKKIFKYLLLNDKMMVGTLLEMEANVHFSHFTCS